MKLKGEFILREIMGEIIAIPVGDTALGFNGMVCLNPVAYEIWQGLQEGRNRVQLLEEILEKFDVSREEAVADLDEFLSRLREAGLLEE